MMQRTAAATTMTMATMATTTTTTRVTAPIAPATAAARIARCALAIAGFAIAGAALGCGGGQRADPAPAGGAQESPAQTSGGDATVPPDKIDEITHMLERKRSAMSRCLSMAVDNKELPRNAQGKVTLEIVISPAGTADQVKIVRATVQSKMLEDCVIGHVKEIAFPQIPVPFETSFTYGFEAM
jgi:hypothetical protein